MSLYAEYVKEREGKLILEDDHYFVTYSLLPEAVFVHDMYVEPLMRRSGWGTRLGDMLTDIAKQHNLLKLICTVCPNSLNGTDSLKAILSYGFKLDSVASGLIVLTKTLS